MRWVEVLFELHLRLLQFGKMRKMKSLKGLRLVQHTTSKNLTIFDANLQLPAFCVHTSLVCCFTDPLPLHREKDSVVFVLKSE